MAISSTFIRDRLHDYPLRLFEVLIKSAESSGVELYISGGSLRDWLLGRVSSDLDFTISYDAESFLEQVRDNYGAGTIVPLGTRHDDTCRLVFDGYAVDVSGFRHGSATIEEDLSKRDFTINALSADFRTAFSSDREVPIIDPMKGTEDIRNRLVRACPGAFSDDPLRMLRAFRFAASLGFEIVSETLSEISAKANLIDLSAAERIYYELDHIMASSRAYPAFIGMDTVGLTTWVMPELYEGNEVRQPSFHHLDVLQHNLYTLDCLEKIVSSPHEFFPDNDQDIVDYLNEGNRLNLVKWAALFHDIGKPATKAIATDKDNKITFYGHDEAGAEKFDAFAQRMRWSRSNREQVRNLIAMHMHPFHLNNVIRAEGQVSDRAQLKICRKAGEHLTGLFLVAMADSLAGQGDDKVDGIETELASLFFHLNKLNQEKVIPVMNGPKLLTGHDLINIFGISPGPGFREIFSGLDLAVIEGSVKDRDGAITWVEAYLANKD